MTELHLAPGLDLPLDAVTRATAIVGQRGTGKTSTAVVFVEEAAAAGAHFAVIDPTGAWYGLTSNAAGTGAGLDCVVMGGHNGDIPLEPESGALVARLVVEERYSVVCDLERMTKSKQVQFVAQFCEDLYHRNRAALTLVVDEAHRFAPQQLRDSERGGFGAKCLGAVTDVVTLGRRKGLGAVLISQRPAKINKDVFEESEIVVAHRLMGTNDRKAIAGWLEEKDAESKAEADAALAKLRTLQAGHALVYAPTMGVFGDYAIRKKRTFDSSATPEIGGEIVTPKKRSEIDLTALQERMAETVERAKADDPKALRTTIRELRGELARLSRDLDQRPDVKPDTVEVPVLGDEALEELRAARVVAAKVAAALDAVPALADALASVDRTITKAVDGLDGGQRPAREAAAKPAISRPGTRPVEPPRRTSRHTNGAGAPADAAVSVPQQRILNALAALTQIGVSPADKIQLALFAEASPKSSSYTNNLGGLRTAGLIDYPSGGKVELTHDGAAIADAGEAPETVEDLHAYVRRLVGEAKWKVLGVLVDEYPNSLAKGDLAERADVSASSSSFTNNLGSLRTLGLIDYPTPGWVEARPILFLQGAAA